jgi:hypothetical protein
MNRIRRTLAALCAWLVAAGLGRAELRFVEPQANAGTVYTGTRLVHRFAFTNKGPDAADIVEARPSCGCLTPQLSQSHLQPGEAGVLELEVNTFTQPAGPQAWTVHVKYQSSQRTYEIPLQLTARLIAEVTVEPAALVLAAEKASEQELLLIDRRAQPFTITAVGASSPGLQPRLAEQGRDAQGHHIGKIRMAVADEYPAGRHEEIVSIYTDNPAYRELRVPVTVIKHGPQRVTALPGEVTLTTAAGQPFPSRMVLLRDRDNQPVRIERILADDPALVCQWVPGPNNLASLRIRVERQQLTQNNLHSVIHVELSAPVRETLMIPVTCSQR